MALHARHYSNYHNIAKFSTGSRARFESGKKPRHTPESRKEATRRERLRVKALAQAYMSLQSVIPFDSGTKITYLSILKGAVAYIKALEMVLGIREDILVSRSRKRSIDSGDEKENKEDEVCIMKKIKEEPDEI
eukprot:Seg3936.1 transcript_id=Seg3936.1/GoldUCD/mRNA.D3Y31 product="Mesoderm posterior protein 1" protein_id=Seg3936.1/GoldUCD/D3Y31